MSWNSTAETRYVAEIEKEKKIVNDNLPIILDRTPAAVLNLQGAEQQITTSKSAVQASIDTIKRKTAEVKNVVDSMISNTATLRTSIEAKREVTQDLKKKVEGGEVLSAIRKEQAEALSNKGLGNLHSSWVGLWRPLAEESRTGLLVASIAFGLIAIVSIVYLYWEKVAQLLPAFGKGSDVPMEEKSAYFGGFLKKRFPIRVSKI